jgi:hypothetical protein
VKIAEDFFDFESVKYSLVVSSEFRKENTNTALLQDVLQLKWVLWHSYVSTCMLEDALPADEESTQVLDQEMGQLNDDNMDMDDSFDDIMDSVHEESNLVLLVCWMHLTYRMCRSLYRPLQVPPSCIICKSLKRGDLNPSYSDGKQRTQETGHKMDT